MIETLDLLAKDGPALARSLFIWQQMLGDSTTAATRLRGLGTPLVQLPVGSDVTPHVVALEPNPVGLSTREAGLPPGDVICAYVTESGLRLTGSVDLLPDRRPFRRLQILSATGAPHVRQGAERFMLRYRLSPAIFRMRQVSFLAIMKEPGTKERGETVARQSPLHVWIEIEQGGERRLVLPEDSRGTLLAPGEVARLISFPPNAFGSPGTEAAALLFIELMGETLDIGLVGEALLAG